MLYGHSLKSSMDNFHIYYLSSANLFPFTRQSLTEDQMTKRDIIYEIDSFVSMRIIGCFMQSHE